MSADNDRNKEKQHITRILEPKTFCLWQKKFCFQKFLSFLALWDDPQGEK